MIFYNSVTNQKIKSILNALNIEYQDYELSVNHFFFDRGEAYQISSIKIVNRSSIRYIIFLFLNISNNPKCFNFTEIKKMFR